jgi:hypothetical protein
MNNTTSTNLINSNRNTYKRNSNRKKQTISKDIDINSEERGSSSSSSSSSIRDDGEIAKKRIKIASDNSNSEEHEDTNDDDDDNNEDCEHGVDPSKDDVIVRPVGISYDEMASIGFIYLYYYYYYYFV